jgi:hypothetical protein
VVRKWSSVLMLTLTVDPRGFATPEEAWRYVGKKRAIAVLLRTLKRQGKLVGPEWFSALEFHRSGWPHWHVATHASFIAKIDLDRAWSLGHTWVSRTREFMTPDHAVHYVTKYVMKPEVGPPGWVLASTAKIHKFSTSRGLLPRPKRERSEGDGSTRKRRTIGARLADCGQSVNVFEVRGDSWSFVHNLSKEKAAQKIAFDAWKKVATLDKSHGGTERSQNGTT